MDFASEYVVQPKDSGVVDGGGDYLFVTTSKGGDVASLTSDPASRSGTEIQNSRPDESLSSWTYLVDSDSDGENFESEIMDFDEDESASGQSTMHSPPKVSSNTLKFSMRTLIQDAAERSLPKVNRVQCAAENCDATLSHIDKPIQEYGMMVWQCKFCGQKQEVKTWTNIGEDEKDVLYVERDTEGETEDMGPLILETIPPKDAAVIFVIDTSGSMSLPVKGMRGDALDMTSLSEVLKEIIRTDQCIKLSLIPQDLLPQVVDPMAGVVEVNRIQTVKDGLISQLRKMRLEHRVGLVSFSSEVIIHGDCSTMEKTVISAEDCERLSFDDLMMRGEKEQKLKPLSETIDRMEEVIKSLQDQGSTSLGPALTVAIAMAKQVKGSKVIVCTDGVATSGLGNPDLSVEEVEAFYESLVMSCKSDGVSVSVVSFDDCGMADRFGAIPKETGGQVERVHFSHTMFQQALERDLNLQTFATDVFTRFTVDKDMYIDADGQRENSVFQLLGNVNVSCQPCYTFAFRQPSESYQSRPDNEEQEPVSMSTYDVVSFNESRSQNPSLTHSEKKVGVTEAVAFCEESETQSEEGELGNEEKEGATSEGGRPENIGEEEEGVKQCYFQYEVSFTTMSGVRASRVWTSAKPVTSSIQKAEERANPSTLVSNSLHELSKAILQVHRDRGALIRICQMAAETCEANRKLCQDNAVLLKQLLDFKAKVMNVARSQRLDDDTATELRKRENGQV